MSLALKYRPKVFSELVGQKSVYAFLQKMVQTGNVPTGLLFEGAPGVGKTSASRILAAALNCNEVNTPCGTCTSCVTVFSGNSLDVIEIDAASNGLIDDVRALRETLVYATPGNHRLILLDEAQGMSKAAFNALLKTLEEPPEDTTFILLSTDSSKILDTVKSRCMPFTFRRVPVNQVADRLKEVTECEGLEVEGALVELIAQRSQGSMRNALVELDKAVSASVTTRKEYVESTYDPDVYARLLKACASSDFSGIFSALDEVVETSSSVVSVGSNLSLVLRDVLILHSGGALPVGSSLELLTEIASVVPAAKALAAARVLWDLKSKIRVGENSRGFLDLTITVLAQTLQNGLSPSNPLPKPAPRAMTFDEMKKKVTS